MSLLNQPYIFTCLAKSLYFRMKAWFTASRTSREEVMWEFSVQPADAPSAHRSTSLPNFHFVPQQHFVFIFSFQPGFYCKHWRIYDVSRHPVATSFNKAGPYIALWAVFKSCTVICFSRNFLRWKGNSKDDEVSNLTLNDWTPYYIAIMRSTILGEQVVGNDLDINGFATRPKYLRLYGVVDIVSVS
jgi:hypothetical protein